MRRRVLSAMYEYRAALLTEAGRPAEVKQLREMLDFADARLSGLGLDNNEHWDAPDSKLAEAMTSADFSNALMTFVERRMIPGYQTVSFPFEQFIKPETTTNFLAHSRYMNRGSLDDLEYVAEKGSPRPGSVDDATSRTHRVVRWEKQFDFSMEALVNDDLGYFDDHALRMGQSARRSLEKFVSNMLWNATTVARLVGLGALYSTTGRLNTARISTARMAFGQRVDTRGNRIPATLQYIVHHTGLLDTVATIQNSTLVPELMTNAANVVRGTFRAIEDPWLAGTAPNLPWMALTQWNRENIVPFILARWSALPAPLIIRKRSDQETVSTMLGGAGGAVPPYYGDFETGNVVVKVADVWGTYIDNTEGNLYDYRGAYYSDGTAA